MICVSRQCYLAWRNGIIVEFWLGSVDMDWVTASGFGLGS
jgi:hypothetical protein